MIIDSITNMEKYTNLLPGLDTVIKLVASGIATKSEPGAYPTENPEVRYTVSAYRTHAKNEKGYEVHKRETDVQIILSGHEAIDIAKPDSLQERGPYQTEHDAQFFNGELQTRYHASNGSFAVFLPGEAHEPNLTDNTPDSVKKIVFKIRLN